MPAIDPQALRQIDRFRVRRFVAEGGNAWVFEVEDPTQPGVGLALKLLKPDAAQGAELARFLAEIEKLVRIQHPNIIRVHDRGQDPATGCHFYTMDFIDGGTLSDVRVERAGDPEATRVARRGATLEEVCGYFVGVLAALARLHGQERPILHRDIKPANVLLRRDGTAILGDLGIAKELGGAGLTRAGVVPGTVLYMSPEQAAGEALRPTSDLFSVGLALYRVLTGSSAYDNVDGVDSTNSAAILAHLFQLRKTGRPLELVFPDDVPEAVREVIETACRVRPEDRYQSAEEMADALRAAVRDMRGERTGGIHPVDPRRLRRIGRFKVRRFVAEGGSAWVFEVEDPRLFDARRALKLLNPQALSDDQLRRFHEEVQRLVHISHPSLIRVYEYGRDPGTGCQYYTMDFIDGGTLSDVRAAFLPPEEGKHSARVDEIVRYFADVLSALSRLHSQPKPIIHRDIKPANIFVSEGAALLADLGIAKEVGSDKTVAGIIPGTPLYMSPEQARGERPGPQSDLFSLGLTLYRVLTGRTVYEDVEGLDTTNSQAVLYHLWQVQGSGRELEFDFPEEVPRALQAVVRKACRVKVAERYASAQDMREALEAALRAGERGGAGVPGWLKIAAALVALVGVPAGAWLGYRWWIGSAEVRALRAEGAELGNLRRQAQEIVEFVAERGGSGSKRAVAQARKDLAPAMRAIEDGLGHLADGAHDAARAEFAQGRKAADGACESLTRDFLDSSFARASQVAGDRLAPLPAELAAEKEPELWQRIEKSRAALQVPEDARGCARAAKLREGIVASEALNSDAAALTVALQSFLPELAAGEVAAAEKLLAEARAAAVDHPAFREARDAAEREITAARASLTRARQSGDLPGLQATRDLARRGTDGLRQAARISDAVAAQRRAAELAKSAESAGVGLGAAQLALRTAEETLGRSEWVAARDDFAALAGELEELLDAARPALERRSAAEAERKAAIAARVPADELGAADEAAEDARAKLRAGKIDDASRAFDAATSLYRSTADQWRERAQAAGELLASARSAQQRAREIASSHAAYKAELARGDAKLREAEAKGAADPGAGRAAAEEATSAYEVAVAIGRAQRARTQAEAAEAALRKQELPERLWSESAGAARGAWEGARWDEAERLYGAFAADLRGIGERAKAALAARSQAGSARDAAGAKGVPAKALADADALREAGAEALARGDFEEARARYDAARAQYASLEPPPKPNAPPRLVAKSPSARTLDFEVGGEAAFEVSASDPEGERVGVEWLLDGAPAGDGPRFALRDRPPGSYEVAAVARDAAGARSETLRWRVNVKPPPAVARVEKPAPRQEPEPRPAEPPAQKPDDAPGPPPSDDGPQRTVALWCSAWAEEDASKLDQIWSWTPEERAKNEKIWKSADFEQTCGQVELSRRGAWNARAVWDVDRTTDGARTAKLRCNASLIPADSSPTSWLIDTLSCASRS
jgi:serine/threonine protein kinase